jgi:hypothetical protein
MQARHSKNYSFIFQLYAPFVMSLYVTSLHMHRARRVEKPQQIDFAQFLVLRFHLQKERSRVDRRPVAAAAAAQSLLFTIARSVSLSRSACGFMRFMCLLSKYPVL